MITARPSVPKQQHYYVNIILRSTGPTWTRTFSMRLLQTTKPMLVRFVPAHSTLQTFAPILWPRTSPITHRQPLIPPLIIAPIADKQPQGPHPTPQNIFNETFANHKTNACQICASSVHTANFCSHTLTQDKPHNSSTTPNPTTDHSSNSWQTAPAHPPPPPPPPQDTDFQGRTWCRLLEIWDFRFR